MFIVSLSSKRLKKLLPALAVIAAIAAFSVIVFGNYGKKSASVSAPVNCRAGNENERLAFIAQFGWEVEQQPEYVKEVLIPDEFDDVYLRYNELQKTQNFDLTPYKGRRVKCWSYNVLNYPGENGMLGNVRINLLVFEGFVIGGDVCSNELDGFMHGFKAESVD